MEFKVINTQEEFDAAIKDRLERERKTVESKFSDYDSLKTQIADLTKEKEGLEAKVKEHGEKYAGRPPPDVALMPAIAALNVGPRMIPFGSSTFAIAAFSFSTGSSVPEVQLTLFAPEE